MSKTAPPTACPVYTAAAEATTTGAPGRALGDLDEVKRQAINGAVAALLDWEYSPEAIAATVSRVVGFEVTVEEVPLCQHERDTCLT